MEVSREKDAAANNALAAVIPEFARLPNEAQSRVRAKLMLAIASEEAGPHYGPVLALEARQRSAETSTDDGIRTRL